MFDLLVRIFIVVLFLALAFGVLYRLKKDFRKRENDEETEYWRRWR